MFAPIIDVIAVPGKITVLKLISCFVVFSRKSTRLRTLEVGDSLALLCCTTSVYAAIVQ